MTLANNPKPRIPLGFGAIEYGGPAIRGRKRMKQFQEHNEGVRPSLSYRSAEFLPVVARDENMDGAPIVMFAGSVLAPAEIDSNGVLIEVPHALALANGGVHCGLNYGQDSIAQVEDLTTLGTLVGSTNVDTGSSGDYLAANKPIGVASGNVYSAAMEKINRNWKLQHETMFNCDYLVEYPVDNIFMSGGTIDVSTVVSRGAYGLADHTITLTVPETLRGIQGGDIVVVNPYLPGTLISISDLEKLVAGSNLDVIADDLRLLWGGGNIATAGYIADQKVGKVEKRQTFMRIQDDAGVISITARDAYSESLNMVTTATGFGLSGKDSGGVDAHLHSAFAYSSKDAGLIGNAGSPVDVSTIWVNLQF